MGRVNFLVLNDQRKGFHGYVTREDNSQRLDNWNVYNLAFNDDLLAKIYASSSTGSFWRDEDGSQMSVKQPTFHLFVFNMNNNPSDQFIEFQV